MPKNNVLNAGRVACPNCQTVQFVVPNRTAHTCPSCGTPLALEFERGQVTSVEAIGGTNGEEEKRSRKRKSNKG
jgi:uncharacterized Zn finger protein (UPF0148 family)